VLKDAYALGGGAALLLTASTTWGWGIPTSSATTRVERSPYDGGCGHPQLIGVEHHAIYGFTSIGAGVIGSEAGQIIGMMPWRCAAAEIKVGEA